MKKKIHYKIGCHTHKKTFIIHHVHNCTKYLQNLCESKILHRENGYLKIWLQKTNSESKYRQFDFLIWRKHFTNIIYHVYV